MTRQRKRRGKGKKVFVDHKTPGRLNSSTTGSPLLQLPVELLVIILSHLDRPTDLHSVVCASPVFLKTFQSSDDTILESVWRNHPRNPPKLTESIAGARLMHMACCSLPPFCPCATRGVERRIVMDMLFAQGDGALCTKMARLSLW